MMNLNRVQLLGNIGKVDFSVTAGGKPRAALRVATHEHINGAKKTSWHTVIAWETLATQVKNLSAGARVFVEGSLRYRDFTDDKNVKHSFTEIAAQRIIFLDKKDSDTSEEQE